MKSIHKWLIALVAMLVAGISNAQMVADQDAERGELEAF
jgi:hypothetical protein